MRVLLVLALVLLGLVRGTQDPASEAKPAVVFVGVEVWIDSGAAPLAAWQVEVEEETGAGKLVGITGGEHAAFEDPPSYDPRALQEGRVVLAAYDLGEDLPQGRTRVASLTFAVDGGAEPEFVQRGATAATADGTRIPIELTLER